MILLDNLLIHKDILEESFTCDLDRCKGACCREGEFGAPLDDSEIPVIEEILDTVLDYLPEKNRRLIREKGVKTYYRELDKFGTPLMESGACAFLIEDESGIGKCAFEKAMEEGKTNFKKPVSCHLYPIRIERNEVVDMDYLNYDRWHICKAACSLGNKLKKPLFEFCSEALERKYGPEFILRLRELKTALDNKEEETN